MNSEQIKSGIRWLITAAGGMLLGVFVTKGWITADQAHSFLSSDLIVGTITTLVGLIWGVISKTAPNLIAVVDSLPKVEGVILKPDAEGQKIAAAVPSTTVVVAGTAAAKEVAS